MSDAPNPQETMTGLGLFALEEPDVSTVEDGAERETSPWTKQRSGTTSSSLVGRTIGSYKITRVLGEGGVGTVYLGEHPIVGSKVAIKVLHDDFADSTDMVERFVLEARAANAISSPHIVRVSDFGKLDDGRDYAVMEYIQGRSLFTLLRQDGPLAIERVVQLVTQIAVAMAAAHDVGVIHRDLKPENLLVETLSDGSEFVRILDFGIAKLLDEEETDARRTAVGSILGTPAYCSPEQARGQKVGPPADIYALGAVAYELLTGRQAFTGTVVDILVAKATVDVPPLGRADVPQVLNELVTSMLARAPSQRPASMDEVVDRLGEFKGPAPSPLNPRAKKKTQVDAATLVSAASPPRPGGFWTADDLVSLKKERSPSDKMRSSRPELASGAPVTVGTSRLSDPPTARARKLRLTLVALTICAAIFALLVLIRPLSPRDEARSITPASPLSPSALSKSAPPIVPVASSPASSPASSLEAALRVPPSAATPSPLVETRVQNLPKTAPNAKPPPRPRVEPARPSTKGTLIDPFE